MRSSLIVTLKTLGLCAFLWLAGSVIAHAGPLEEGCDLLPSKGSRVLGKASNGDFCADAIRFKDTFGTTLFRIFEGNEKVFETKEALPCHQCVRHKGETFRGITWDEDKVTLHIQHGQKAIRIEELTLGKVKGQWKPLFWDRSIYEPKTTGEWFEQVDLQTYYAHVQYRLNDLENRYCSKHAADLIACSSDADRDADWEEVCTVNPDAYALDSLSYLRVSMVACYHTTPEEIALDLMMKTGDSPIAMPPFPIEGYDPRRRSEI